MICLLRQFLFASWEIMLDKERRDDTGYFTTASAESVRKKTAGRYQLYDDLQGEQDPCKGGRDACLPYLPGTPGDL